MSADGEVQVQVSAEGVDDAAEELGDAGGEGGVGGAGGGGGGEGPSGLRGSLKAGLYAGLLTSVAGPLLEVLDPILSVLQAFLAPIAALALRLLSPVLRFLLTKILPVWFKWLNVSDGLLKFIGAGIAVLLSPILLIAAQAVLLYAAIQFVASKLDDAKSAITSVGSDVWSFVKGGVSDIVSKVGSLPGDIWQEVKQLANLIGQELAERLPSVGSASDTGRGALTSDSNPAYRAGQAVGDTIFSLEGDAAAVVTEVEKKSGLDFP